MRTRSSTKVPAAGTSGPRAAVAPAASRRAAAAGVSSAPPLRGPGEPRPAALSRTLSAALTAAREVRRSHAPEGREALLTAGEAARFEALALRLAPALRARIDALLEPPPDVASARGGRAGGAAPTTSGGGPGDAGWQVARALLLRALLARLPALDARELDHVAAFREELLRLTPEQMLARSTVLDLDSTRNDNLRDPMAAFDRRGVIYPRGEGDTAADNDGLFQRFSASCGPTVVEMLLAQLDPLFAFALTSDPITSSSATDRAAELQRELLVAHGGVAIPNPAGQLRARMRNALGRLTAEGGIDRAAAELLGRELGVRGGAQEIVPALSPRAAEVVERLRERFDGFPTAVEVEQLRRTRHPERDEGLATEALEQILRRFIGPKAGVDYRPTNPPGGFARGGVWRHVDNLARALRRGIDVPFGISEPAHWMLASAVSGRRPERRFLISDPAGGRTAWVNERDLLRGTFVRDQFNLCVGRERGYIDVLFLPAPLRAPPRP